MALGLSGTSTVYGYPPTYTVRRLTQYNLSSILHFFPHAHYLQYVIQTDTQILHLYPDFHLQKHASLCTIASTAPRAARHYLRVRCGVGHG